MEGKIQQIHQMIKELFPESVSVKVFVNSEGIEVTPNFKTDLAHCSMKNITGKWVKKSV